MEIIKNFLWNYMFVPLFLVTGMICVRAIIAGRKAGRGRKKAAAAGEMSPFQVMLVNLASTIGTGNIVGVALGIAAGGAGSVFWMWVAALVGMVVSYSENALGFEYKGENDRPVGYMPKGVSRVFSLFCIITSLGIGNMVQSNSAAGAMESAFGTERWLTGAVFTVLAFVIIKGGLKGITNFTDFFVPVMSMFYIVSALFVIFINIENIPGVFESIFKEAFSARAISGGAIAIGIARGVMSGEAGVGSSVILAKKSSAESAHQQGLVGAMSIFTDTLVICTLTALAILSTNSVSTQGAFYSALGVFGGKILDLSIVFFAFTTIVGWSYFGLECTGYLFGERAQEKYKLIYAICAFAGAVTAPDVVWGIGDISCALMALPNLLCLCVKFGGRNRGLSY